MPKRIHWDDRASAGRNARAQLPRVLAAYYQEGRKLLRSAPSAEDLHAFRLKTKRLRYTLELFRSCYDAGFEQRLSLLRKNQTLLGDINDCEATRRLLEKRVGRRTAQWSGLDRFLKARARGLVTAFRKHWRESFDAPGRERKWVAYLERVIATGRRG